jgi:hypothetical protein
MMPNVYPHYLAQLTIVLLNLKIPDLMRTI